MKLMGAALVVWSAVCVYLQRRREGMLPVRVGRALLADLPVLSFQICVLRRPLPELLEEALLDSPCAPFFWRPLREHIRAAERGEADLPACWARAAADLPGPLGRLTRPLGPLLPAGGERLAAAIEETREELAGFLREETARQAGQGRITAALCLSGALLLILVLI